jgi:hypothetical protein
MMPTDLRHPLQHRSEGLLPVDGSGGRRVAPRRRAFDRAGDLQASMVSGWRSRCPFLVYSPRMRPHVRSVPLFFAALCAVAAQAEVIDIAWSGDGRFERRVTVAPGKFAEVCGKLTRADAVAWRFDATGPLNFNIHYHEGKDVRFPERRDALSSASGRLPVALDQDYCWMWINKSGQAVDLQLLLTR